MCRGAACVRPEAQAALADLLLSLATALDPEHPGDVVIGPVDFGSDDHADCGHVGAETDAGAER